MIGSVCGRPCIHVFRSHTRSPEWLVNGCGLTCPPRVKNTHSVCTMSCACVLASHLHCVLAWACINAHHAVAVTLTVAVAVTVALADAAVPRKACLQRVALLLLMLLSLSSLSLSMSLSLSLSLSQSLMSIALLQALFHSAWLRCFAHCRACNFVEGPKGFSVIHPSP